MKDSDRYLKIVEWSPEDHCYVGTCPGLMLGGVHGDDEVKVYEELCQVVAEWVKLGRTDGIPLPEPTAGKQYSGRFVLRVGKDLHRELAIAAAQAGESLNAYCVTRLHPRVHQRVQQHGRSAQRCCVAGAARQAAPTRLARAHRTSTSTKPR